MASGLVLAAAYYAHENWWHIRYRLAQRRLYHRHVTNPEDGIAMGNSNKDGTFYDAFVSYSNADKEWVTSQLMPTLEDGHGMRLCIHERDFAVGSTIIENIAFSLDKSMGCVIVLSQDYVESDWCKFEAHVALQNSMERKSILQFYCNCIL